MVSAPPDDVAHGNGPRVYICAELDEAESLEALLSARGVAVWVVAFDHVTEWVGAKAPSVVVCDLDREPTMDNISRLRDLPGGSSVEVLYVTSRRPSQSSLTHVSSGTFARPLDSLALVRCIEAATATTSTPSEQGPSGPVSTIPPPTAASHPPYLGFVIDDDPPNYSSAPPGGSSHPPSSRSARPPDDPSQFSLPPPVPLGFAGEASGWRPAQVAAMSPELEALLARAEQRIGEASDVAEPPPSMRLSPDEELEAVLPAEVLASLDEPLELDHDDDMESEGGSAHGTRSGTGPKTGLGTNVTGLGAHVGATAAGGPLPTFSGYGAGSTSGVEPTAPPPSAGAEGDPPSEEAPATPGPTSTRPPLESAVQWPAPANAVVTAVERPSLANAPLPPSPTASLIREQLPTVGPQRPAAAPRITYAEAAPPAPLTPEPSGERLSPEIPSALAAGDGLTALAQGVRSRFTGAIAFEDALGIRRVVLRDGDVVTAASGATEETLLAFLVERGLLTSDAAQRFGNRLPPFGRHAGAALIANGHLRQDELWPILRAHSEWIVGRIMRMQSGEASVEREVPPRLQAEPAVFGGATGAEVLVEVARRVIAPEEALRQLGGESTRLSDGPSAALLGECALAEAESALVRRATTLTLGEVLHERADPGFAAVIRALVALGVLDTLTAPRTAQRAVAETYEFDALDEAAVRARILARRALVDEGDYFAVLGLPRGCTGYDVRRAYLELRRAFEPSRILTAASADLRQDVDLIVDVLDEAYEILRDNLRRERYRRALDSTP